MVGPTGSGKSTTLYSMLNALNGTDKKIITLEDPIEYGITGISQIPIKTNDGGSFGEALRSVLRLDPDIVMVGEIRDADTAKTAIQASITGHLVLSSFHADSSAAAFSRMVDLIGTNPIFANSIRLVVAQRLVRKLTDAKEEYEPDEGVKDYIRKTLEGVEGFNPDNIKLYRPVSTEENPFGYSGRAVIMEQLVVSEEISEFIRGDVAEISVKKIEETARKNGMLTLEQKGLLMALKGVTTLEEVSRVV
jgi:type II secretory ATPase GspE/PulE/Tfp pilus assembly ATPase PilB-like protein